MEHKVLGYQDLRKIVWFIADTIRDKGRGNSNDYMSITVGVLFLKRLVDMRAEFKNKFVQKGTVENGIYLLNSSNIDLALQNHQSKSPEFEVNINHLWTYRLEWSDIENYKDNSDKKQISKSYNDNLKGNQLITSIENKVVLLKEVIDSFKHPIIHDIFSTLNFIPKIYNTVARENVLDVHDFESIITELNKYSFALEFASQDVFADVYMDLLGRFASDGGKKGGEFFTPTKLVRGAIKFLNMKFKERKIIVSDLTAGACTFMVEFANMYKVLFSEYFKHNNQIKFNDYVEFITGEKERVSKALGDGNMLLHGYSSNHKSFHANSITEYDSHLGLACRQQVDYLLANPPYGLKDYGQTQAMASNKDRWSFGIPNKGEGEYAFVMTILDMLNEEGKAVVVLPLGTLFKDITATYREKIIRKNWLEGIVLLPSSMFLTTSIPVCLWIINKKKDIQDQNKIFMINSSNDFIKVGKINEWNDEKAVDAYNSRKEIKGYSGYVNLEKIIKNKYNLSMSRYFSEEKLKENINLNKLNIEINQLMNLITSEMQELSLVINQVIEIESKDEK